MKRVFGSLHPFFEGGPINGRKLANAGFMTALLALDPFEEYHFFVGNPQGLREEWASLGRLSALERGAVRALHRSDLPRRLRETPYHAFHFSDPVTFFTELCSLRNMHAPEIFPVTAVNHSISYREYAGPFLAHLWPGCAPRDAIGANSHAALQALRGWFAHLGGAYGLDPARCPHPLLRVMPMGVDPALFPRPGEGGSARRSMRRRLNLEESAVLLLLFGRIALDDKMDFGPLLMALRRARAARSRPDVHLVVSGYVPPGGDAGELPDAVARLLDVPLHVLPNPAPEEKYALFAAADIFVSPADNIQETFGLSLLEAACAGLPVIASDWDGYRDIVVHGETGLLVPTLAPMDTPDLDALAPALYDNQHQFQRGQRTAVLVPALAHAVESLAVDGAARRRMGEAARKRALESFTWRAAALRWLAFWEELRAVPLTPEDGARLRAARHPMHLPFGRMFAHYGGGTPPPSARLRCTEAGRDLRENRMPWEVAGKTPPIIHRQSLHALLVWARRPASMEELAARNAGSPGAMDSETLHAHILWALKHDFLELCA